MARRNKTPMPLSVGTLLVRTKRVPGDVSNIHKQLVILEYKRSFRSDDPYDAAFIYQCWDPVKNIKVELYDWYKREPYWKVIPVD